MVAFYRKSPFLAGLRNYLLAWRSESHPYRAHVENLSDTNLAKRAMAFIAMLLQVDSLLHFISESLRIASPRQSPRCKNTTHLNAQGLTESRRESKRRYLPSMRAIYLVTVHLYTRRFSPALKRVRSKSFVLKLVAQALPWSIRSKRSTDSCPGIDQCNLEEHGRQDRERIGHLEECDECSER